MAADVVIISAFSRGGYLPLGQGVLQRYLWHRIIVDECHTGFSGSRGLHLPHRSNNRWAVTGTPVSSALSDLEPVGDWIGQFKTNQILATNIAGVTSNYGEDGKRAAFTRVVDSVRKLMIRHTKSMQIGGEAALALPVLTSETINLDMGTAERSIYNLVHKAIRTSSKIKKARKEGLDGLGLSMKLSDLYQACSGTYDSVFYYNARMPSENVANEDVTVTHKGKPHETRTYAIGKPIRAITTYSTLQLATVLAAEKEATKIKALEKDLQQLQAVEPAFHAVVFTHLSSVLERVAAMARTNAIKVFEIKTGVSMKLRHQAMLDFQVLDGLAKILVTTVRVGNTGMNVQSATRVYLMEPSINPQVEIQCAGRIHRLGQRRDVLVRRFCFRDSIEEKIVSLHAKIEAGDATIPNGKVPAAVVKSLTNRPGDPTTPPSRRRGKSASYGYGGGYGGGGYAVLLQQLLQLQRDRDGGYGYGYGGDSEDEDEDNYW